MSRRRTARPPRVITYRGVPYHLHTGLFGRTVVPSWEQALAAVGDLQEQSRKLYRAAQELQRLVSQQLPGAKTLGTRVQQLLPPLVEQLKRVLQHTPA